MEDLLDSEHKKILLEDRWRSRFNELKRSFEDEVDGNKEEVMAEIISIKEKSEAFKIYSLVTQIDVWMKGDRVYDLEEYLTCQEIEHIIAKDQYYLHKEFVSRSFLDKDTVSTILKPHALIERWIAEGLASLEGCPWTPPPRWDYSYQRDCNDSKSSCIKVVSLRHFLSNHRLPVPAAIFPDDPQNTSFTLGRIEQGVKTLAAMRESERKDLELKELRRKSEQTGNKVQAVIQEANAVETPKVLIQPDQMGISYASSNKTENVTALYNAELERLYSRDYELWQRVHCYYEANVNGTSNQDLIEIVSKRNNKTICERTISRWISKGEEFAVHDPAGPKLPPLAKPIQRRK